jgi:hypothetical protein
MGPLGRRDPADLRHPPGAHSLCAMFATAELAPFVVSVADARARLGDAALAPEQRTLALHALRRSEGQHVLWIDQAWTPGKRPAPSRRTARPKGPLADSVSVAMIVFEQPLAHPGSLSLRYEALTGYSEDRNTSALVFLGEVCTRDICLVPETLAVFAAGLRVERLAIFDGADAMASVAGHLHAPLAYSSNGGGLSLTTDCAANVAHLTGYVKRRLPGARVHRSLRAMLPFLTDEDEARIDDEDVWALFEDELTEAARWKGFVVPSLAKTSAKKTAAKKTSAKTTSAKTTSAKTTSAKTTSAKTTSAKTTSAKTTSAKTTSAKTTAAKTTSAKTTSAKTTSAKTASAKTTSAKTTSAKKTSAKKTSAKRTE